MEQTVPHFAWLKTMTRMDTTHATVLMVQFNVEVDMRTPATSAGTVSYCNTGNILHGMSLTLAASGSLVSKNRLAILQ